MKPTCQKASPTANGGFAELQHGSTYYITEGSNDGVPLVAIHGATVPSWQFDTLMPLLHGSGFRTLRFDLYGHGFSARPKAAYSLDLFARQTLELLERLEFPRPAAILGHSFGAAVSARAIGLRPDWADAAILNAPLLDFSARNRLSPLLRTPLIGEAVMTLIGRPALTRRRHRRFGAIGRPDLARRFDQQSRITGFWRALLSMERAGALADHSRHYRRLGETMIPTLVIYGSRDQVIPAEHIDRIRSLLPEHRYAELAGCEHNLLFTAPEQVAEHIVPFVAGTSCFAGARAPRSDR